MEPRKSNQGEEGLRKTQKRVRNKPLRSEFVSPEDEGLSCNEKISVQILRSSDQKSVKKLRRGKYQFNEA